MDDGGGKFDHGVCLVLVCTRSRLSPPPFKALTGRWSRDKTEAPSTARGAMLILILPEVQVVGNYPSRLSMYCRWLHCFCSLGVCVRCVDDRDAVDQWARGLVAGSPQSSGTFIFGIMVQV